MTLWGYRNKFNEETAIYVGSPGNNITNNMTFYRWLLKQAAICRNSQGQLFSEVLPCGFYGFLPNNVLALYGITYGFKGINQNIANHAVSGTQAIIEAYHAIRTGQAERAVVVAYDVGSEPQLCIIMTSSVY